MISSNWCQNVKENKKAQQPTHRALTCFKEVQKKNREFISYKCHGHKSNLLNVNCHINVLLFVLGGGLHVNILLCELLIVRGS